MAKDVKFRFYDRDYFILCLFLASGLSLSVTYNIDHSNSWHHRLTIKPKTKELSLEYCVFGVQSAANEGNGNCSCLVG